MDPDAASWRLESELSEERPILIGETALMCQPVLGAELQESLCLVSEGPYETQGDHDHWWRKAVVTGGRTEGHLKVSFCLCRKGRETLRTTGYANAS